MPSSSTSAKEPGLPRSPEAEQAEITRRAARCCLECSGGKLGRCCASNGVIY